VFEVADGRLNGLPPLQPTALLGTERAVLAAVNEVDVGVIRIDAAKAQVNQHLLRKFSR
jgi:hypothetical protein